MRVTDSEYFELLKRIRVGKLEDKDRLELEKRFVDNLSDEEKLNFAKNAIFLFAERSSMTFYNE